MLLRMKTDDGSFLREILVFPNLLVKTRGERSNENRELLRKRNSSCEKDGAPNLKERLWLALSPRETLKFSREEGESAELDRREGGIERDLEERESPREFQRKFALMPGASLKFCRAVQG